MGYKGESASGVEEAGPVLCPAVDEGVDPLLAVQPGQVLPLQWQCYSAVKGPWWQAQSCLACTYCELKRQKPERGFRSKSQIRQVGSLWAPC